jgi:predicted amidohydrolase YtcJ
MLIAAAQLSPTLTADVRFAHGVITEIGVGLARAPGEERIDARGAALIPGLHDHHVHLRALAAARASVDVGPHAITGRAALGDALRAAPGAGWIRAAGYHEAVAGELDAAALDALVPDRPVRVQHRTGQLWILNSAALRAAGPPPPGIDAADGRVWRGDDWLRRVVPPPPLDYAALAAEALARGVTGFTDATPSASAGDVEDLDAAVRTGAIPQHVTTMGAGLPTGSVLALGPRKFVLDEPRLPPLDALVEAIRHEHARRRPVAIHALTRVELVLALTALELAGPHPGDRIEHASVVPAALLPALRPLTLVLQPHHVRERGDAQRETVDPADLPDLHRLASLDRAGIPLAAGTDAPFGGADPWAAIAAATTRTTRAGVPLNPQEAVGARRALALFLGGPTAPATPRGIAIGTADAVLLDAPLADVLATPDAGHVVMTVIGGRRST